MPICSAMTRSGGSLSPEAGSAAARIAQRLRGGAGSALG